MMTSFHELGVSPSGGPIVRGNKGAIPALARLSPDAFSRLSQLSVEDALHSSRPEGTLIGSPLYPLERVRQHKSTLDEVGLKLVQSLPGLSSLTALVISDDSTTTIIPL